MPQQKGNMTMTGLNLLDYHLNKLWTMPQQRLDDTKKVKESWQLDPMKLTVKQYLARGASGSVHRGLYDGKVVAVKLLDWGDEDQNTVAQIASFRAAFRQEVSVWHKLSHPNVSQFIGAMTSTSDVQFQTQRNQMRMSRNMCCLVTDYQPAGTLKSYLFKNRKRKLPFKIVMQFALDLAKGLSYLHSKKIVHRDVKTDNVLLDENQTLKITDFGIARIEALFPKDMTGYTGSLGYMAPEVFERRPYNRKCDVYSFGICLWEIYCCDVPYQNLSFSELTSGIVYENLRPQIPLRCPRSLANVMKSCWDADPKRRPEMEEVVTMLKAIDISKAKGMTPLEQPLGCFCFMPCRLRKQTQKL